MKTDTDLQYFMFNVLEYDLNQTASHRTDLPMKKDQTLNYVIDLNWDSKMSVNFFKIIGAYDFIKMSNLNQNVVENWRYFGLKEPVPFYIEIRQLKDVTYSYNGKFTMMKFIFGGRKFELPIERIEDTY